MKFAEFAENIKEVYNGKFAHSACMVRPYRCLGKSIVIDCYLAENLGECANGIAGNDMFKISFCIGLPDNFNYETDELEESLVMQCWGNNYLVKPENQYLCYGRRKVAYRKATGTAEKLVTVFGKFVDKLHAQLLEDLNSGNVHENHEALVKQKI